MSHQCYIISRWWHRSHCDTAIVKIADMLRHFFKTAPLAAPVVNEYNADAMVVREDLLQELDEDEGENDKGENDKG